MGVTTSSDPIADDAPRGPERSVRRDTAHGALLVVPWGFFGWLWWRVLQETSAVRLEMALGLVLILAAVSVSITFAWILHNLRIFRRKGTRQGLPAPALDYRVDWTRRPVDADWPAVRTAHVVIVFATSERKVFLPGTAIESSGFSSAVETTIP